MKEQPIIFNSNMVKAILEGRKTQTRRPVKCKWLNGNWKEDYHLPEKQGCSFLLHHKRTAVSNMTIKCPYGKVGDRLLKIVLKRGLYLIK